MHDQSREGGEILDGLVAVVVAGGNLSLGRKGGVGSSRGGVVGGGGEGGEGGGNGDRGGALTQMSKSSN